jgi:thiol-disulfide isomerase/thioredoxin
MVWLQAAFLATVFSAAGDTVLLDFYADWCGPCRAMDPTISALAAEGVPVRKVNIDRDPQMAGQFSVTSIPCYVMLVDGQEVDRVVGGTTYSRLKRMCELGLAQRTQQQQPPLALAQNTTPATRPPAAFPAQQSGLPLRTAAGQPVHSPAPPPLPGRQPSVPGGWYPQRATEPSPDDALIAASVRLRIEDANGHSCGSGTIIDAREGEALILTCGHIFRESKGIGRIEVDLFGPEGIQQVAGKLVSYNLDRDVGLLSIRTPGPVATAPVAPAGYRIGPGDSVVSVGCNNGDRPTARRSQVTSLDKFLGPPNLQVAGLPVEGRSGGGLFSRDGLVIGVCNAADPQDNEGLYAALASIHAELDQGRLSFVYDTDNRGLAPQPTGPASSALAAADEPAMPERMPRSWGAAAANEFAAGPASSSAGEAAALSAEEQAALEEIRRRVQEGAEVVCVVSPRQPGAKSEVIILDRASAALLGQLAAMGRSQDPLRSTSLEVPKRQQPADNPSARAQSPTTSGTISGRRPPAGNRAGDSGGWRLSGLEPVARR